MGYESHNFFLSFCITLMLLRDSHPHQAAARLELISLLAKHIANESLARSIRATLRLRHQCHSEIFRPWPSTQFRNRLQLTGGCASVFQKECYGRAEKVGHSATSRLQNLTLPRTDFERDWSSSQCVALWILNFFFHANRVIKKREVTICKLRLIKKGYFETLFGYFLFYELLVLQVSFIESSWLFRKLFFQMFYRQ